MSKNALIGLGIVVVLLTAWLVIGVAYQTQTGDEVEATDTAATNVQTPEVDSGQGGSNEPTAAVETSVDIANNQVPTSVTVE